MNVFTCTSVKEFLNAVFHLKKSKNSRYSIRAFSRHLGMSHSSVLGLMNGTAPVTVDRMKVINKILGLKDEHAQYIEILARFESATETELQQSLNAEVLRLRIKERVRKLAKPEMQLMRKWFVYPLLAMIKFSEQFDFSIPNAAQKLSVSESEIESVLKRLETLKIVEIQDGKYKRSNVRLLLQSESMDEDLQAYHRIMLMKSIENIGVGDIGKKYVGTETFAFDENKITEAKAILDKACDQLLALASACDQKNSIYHLNFYFYPLLTSIQNQMSGQKTEKEKYA